MTHLSQMDRQSRALWQDAAARKRRWYARGFGFKRSLSVIRDVQFTHGWLIKWARQGQPYNEYWWS